MIRKGFTLVELLAVIVVLALISVIAVPKILKLVDDSKEGIVKENALQYIKAIESHNQEAAIDNKPNDRITGFVDVSTITIKVKGKKPDSGYLNIDEDNRVENGQLCYGNFKATYENSEVTVEKVENCVADEELEPGLYDSKNHLLASWDTLVNEYNLDIDGSHSSGEEGTMLYILDTYYSDFDKLKLVISDDVEIIGYQAFSGCSQIANIIIPDSVTEIQDEAFLSSGITSIVIPEGVESIGSDAIEGCYNLKSIKIPSSVTSMGYNALLGGIKLLRIDVDSSNPNYSSVDGIFFDKNKTILYRYPPARTDQSYTVPSTVKTIYQYAFEDSKNLTKITLPNDLTSIEHDAFRYTNITSITIPGSVSEIGSSAFYDCKKLSSVTLSNGIETLGWYTFRGCESLTSITIPSSVKEIGYETFKNCSKLTSVTFVNTSGWQASRSGKPTVDITVTNSTTNASNLTGTYSDYLWKCT